MKRFASLMGAAVLGVLAGWAGSGAALAQSPNITSFQGNGQLTWTNSDTNLFYQVQWASSLIGTGVWQSSYSDLLDVRSTNAAVTISVPMFLRVAGSSNRTQYASHVPKTGQTNSDTAGDDGALKAGAAWPAPRFTAGTGSASNCVVDNLTGLMWLMNPTSTTFEWTNAVTYCRGLNGSAGRGGYADWRLPNCLELQSVIDFSQANPALPVGHPFKGVQSDWYWCSTTCAGGATNAWAVGLDTGGFGFGLKSGVIAFVWPVRGGP